MAQFEWQGETLATFGDIANAMDAIRKLPDPEDRQRTADAFMEAYRAHTEYADANVGYLCDLCGYYGHDTMVELLRLFQTAHPIFGGPDLADKVTPDSAMAAGQAFGERLRDG